MTSLLQYLRGSAVQAAEDQVSLYQAGISLLHRQPSRIFTPHISLLPSYVAIPERSLGGALAWPAWGAPSPSEAVTPLRHNLHTFAPLFLPPWNLTNIYWSYHTYECSPVLFLPFGFELMFHLALTKACNVLVCLVCKSCQ